MQLQHKTYGQSHQPAIVLLHGLFGSSSNWASVARKLADDYFIIVPDLRNHGQSPHHADVSYPAQANDVMQLLEHLAIQQAILVGHSMGGKVAMQCALQYPGRVANLAVVDMSPVAYSHNFDAVFNAFAAVDLANIQNRRDADAQMAAHVPEPMVRAFLLQNLQKTKQGWQWRLNLAALKARQSTITGFAATGRYRGKAGFIYGENSQYVLPEYHSTIEAFFPQAEYCPVTGAGHWVYADQPEAFMHCLHKFLSL
jgi:esterase